MNPLIETVVGAPKPSVTEAWVPDEQGIQNALNNLKNRFVDERVHGFVHPASGQQIPPVPREEAEARWVAVAQQFLAHMSEFSPAHSQRLGTHRWVDDAEAPAGGAAGEPADLAIDPEGVPPRPQESLVSQTVKKLVT